MKTKDIKIKGKTARGVEIPLKNAVLVIVTGRRGYIMCGYLNLEAAEKFGDLACVVKGVKSIDDLLNAKIVAVTTKAKKAGIKPGMPALKALSKLI
jgi:uncharacterized protein YunC (DUF1805 family)